MRSAPMPTSPSRSRPRNCWRKSAASSKAPSPMRARFALWLALLYGFVIGLFAIAGVALWAALDPPQRDAFRAMLAERAILLATLAFLLLFLLGAVLQWWMSAYPGAAHLLARDTSGLGGTPVGLGRSVFGILDKSLIVHALDQIRRRIEQGSTDPVAQFVTAREGQLLRVQTAPVLDPARGIGGFVLILEDITRAVETSSRRDLLLHQLTEGTRASLGNIRAAVETVQ